MSALELSRRENDLIPLCSGNTVVVEEPREKVDLTPYVMRHEFRVDFAFDETASTAAVYRQCVRPLVCCSSSGSGGPNGSCCSFFAYGQTGSGKTHTMLGPAASSGAEEGIIALAAGDIFGLAGNKTVCVSFFEIYNGRLFDLLQERKLVAALENAKKEVVVKDLREEVTPSKEELLRKISAGIELRRIGVNSVNDESSRSHAVLQILLKNPDGRTAGRIAFIDLAGSERGADTLTQSRQTQQDGCGINRSLLALKECIRAMDGLKGHIPFRDSELTKVLRGALLARSSRSVMIAAVSPATSCCEQTLNTLRYATRVKNFKPPSASSSATAAATTTPALNASGRNNNPTNMQHSQSQHQRESLSLDAGEFRSCSSSGGSCSSNEPSPRLPIPTPLGLSSSRRCSSFAGSANTRASAAAQTNATTNPNAVPFSFSARTQQGRAAQSAGLARKLSVAERLGMASAGFLGNERNGGGAAQGGALQPRVSGSPRLLRAVPGAAAAASSSQNQQLGGSPRSPGVVGEEGGGVAFLECQSASPSQGGPLPPSSSTANNNNNNPTATSGRQPRGSLPPPSPLGGLRVSAGSVVSGSFSSSRRVPPFSSANPNPHHSASSAKEGGGVSFRESSSGGGPHQHQNHHHQQQSVPPSSRRGSGVYRKGHSPLSGGTGGSGAAPGASPNNNNNPTSARSKGSLGRSGGHSSLSKHHATSAQRGERKLPNATAGGASSASNASLRRAWLLQQQEHQRGRGGMLGEDGETLIFVAQHRAPPAFASQDSAAAGEAEENSAMAVEEANPQIFGGRRRPAEDREGGAAAASCFGFSQHSHQQRTSCGGSDEMEEGSVVGGESQSRRICRESAERRSSSLSARSSAPLGNAGDDPSRTLLEHLLPPLSHVASVAASGGEGIAALASTPFSLQSLVQRNLEGVDLQSLETQDFEALQRQVDGKRLHYMRRLHDMLRSRATEGSGRQGFDERKQDLLVCAMHEHNPSSDEFAEYAKHKMELEFKRLLRMRHCWMQAEELRVLKRHLLSVQQKQCEIGEEFSEGVWKASQPSGGDVDGLRSSGLSLAARLADARGSATGAHLTSAEKFSLQPRLRGGAGGSPSRTAGASLLGTAAFFGPASQQVSGQKLDGDCPSPVSPPLASFNTPSLRASNKQPLSPLAHCTPLDCSASAMAVDGPPPNASAGGGRG